MLTVTSHSTNESLISSSGHSDKLGNHYSRINMRRRVTAAHTACSNPETRSQPPQYRHDEANFQPSSQCHNKIHAACSTCDIIDSKVRLLSACNRTVILIRYHGLHDQWQQRHTLDKFQPSFYNNNDDIIRGRMDTCWW